MIRNKSFKGTYKRTKECVMYITVRHSILVVSCQAHKKWSEEVTRMAVSDIVELFDKHKATVKRQESLERWRANERKG